MKKLTTKEFIKKSKQLHGNIYNYSAVNYINCEVKVKIICKIHGEFLQSPSNHLYSLNGCPNCRKNKKLNTVEFIKKAKMVHGEKFDYSEVKYLDWRTPVFIKCKLHGSFKQIPNNHTSHKMGCPICGNEQKQISLNIGHKSGLYAYNKEGFLNEKYFIKYPFKKNLKAVLYKILFWNNDEKFIKLGLTTNLEKRIKYFKRVYKIKIIKILEGTLYNIWKKESELKEKYWNKKYIPEKYFSGRMECFQYGKRVTI